MFLYLALDGYNPNESSSKYDLMMFRLLALLPLAFGSPLRPRALGNSSTIPGPSYNVTSPSTGNPSTSSVSAKVRIYPVGSDAQPVNIEGFAFPQFSQYVYLDITFAQPRMHKTLQPLAETCGHEAVGDAPIHASSTGHLQHLDGDCSETASCLPCRTRQALAIPSVECLRSIRRLFVPERLHSRGIQWTELLLAGHGLGLGHVKLSKHHADKTSDTADRSSTMLLVPTMERRS